MARYAIWLNAMYPECFPGLPRPMILSVLNVWSHLKPTLKWHVTANVINECRATWKSMESHGPVLTPAMSALCEAKGKGCLCMWRKHPLWVEQICLMMITRNLALFMWDVPTPVVTITVLCSTNFCCHYTKWNFWNATLPYIKAPHLTTHAY